MHTCEVLPRESDRVNPASERITSMNTSLSSLHDCGGSVEDGAAIVGSELRVNIGCVGRCDRGPHLLVGRNMESCVGRQAKFIQHY